MSEVKTKKLRHGAEKAREKPKVKSRLRFASLVLAAGLILPACGKCSCTKKAEEKPPAAQSDESMEKEPAALETAERQMLRKFVESELYKVRDLMLLLGANEKDLLLDDAKTETLVDGVQFILNQNRFSETPKSDTYLRQTAADYVVVGASQVIYDNGSAQTRQAVAEFLGLSYYEQKRVDYSEYATFYALAFAEPPQTFSDLFKLIADVKEGKYPVSGVSLPTIITPDSVSTLLPPALVEVKPEEVAVTTHSLISGILTVLEMNGVKKEELAELQKLKDGIIERIFANKKNEKRFVEITFEELYNGSASPETRKLISEVYGIVLSSTGMFNAKEAEIYSTIIDGAPPGEFRGVEKAVKKSKKFVKSGIVLKKLTIIGNPLEEAKTGEVQEEKTEKEEKKEKPVKRRPRKGCKEMTKEEATKLLDKLFEKCNEDAECFLDKVEKQNICPTD